MGAFYDRLAATYEGIPIEVETNASGLLSGNVRLAIGNETVDQGTISMVGGRISLRGKIGSKAVAVVAQQRLLIFGTKYSLLVDGTEHPLNRIN